MIRRALVTGAAGFIGRHVCKQLASQGWQVAGIGLGDWSPAEQRAWGLRAWRNEGISGEALEALARSEGEPELLIHCAGGSSVPFSLAHPREDFGQTVVTIADALEFARRREGGMAFVYPSSAAVYGRVAGRPVSEATPLRPVSPYGLHKRMAEELCQSCAASGKVPAAIIRLFSVYGAGLRKQLLWDACAKAAAGAFVFSGTGGEIRDWIHVSDAAALLVLAATKAAPDCPVVNGGTGEGTSIREVLERLGRWWTPAQTPVFSGAQRPGDPDCYIADVSAVRSWGYRPQADLDAGLQDYIRWFRTERGA